MIENYELKHEGVLQMRREVGRAVGNVLGDPSEPYLTSFEHGRPKRYL